MDKLEILKIISKDLTLISYNNLYNLISDLRLSCVIPFKVFKGDKIYRLRPSTKNEFTKVSEISFNPNAPDFGRANIPNKPMFYGSVAVPKAQNPLSTNTFEIIHILNNSNIPIIDSSIEFTFGEWIVQEDLPIVPMIFHKIFLAKNMLFKPLYEDYFNSKISNKRDSEIISFMAREFAKSKIESPNDYKITATFSEYILNSLDGNPQGILYPSVRTQGEGINVALNPKSINRFLKLTSVFTMRMYYKDNFGVMDGLKYTDNIRGDNTFKLEKRDLPDWNKGRDWCMDLHEKELRKLKSV